MEKIDSFRAFNLLSTFRIIIFSIKYYIRTLNIKYWVLLNYFFQWTCNALNPLYEMIHSIVQIKFYRFNGLYTRPILHTMNKKKEEEEKKKKTCGRGSPSFLLPLFFSPTPIPPTFFFPDQSNCFAHPLTYVALPSCTIHYIVLFFALTKLVRP